MNFYADYVRNKLNVAISIMSSQIEDYVKNPGHDFTRNRKMNFTSTINFLLTMEGGSLNSELHKYFNYDLNQITRSGFIKQRNKLKPDTMEYLFHKFHEQILCNKKYQGYQLLACDGSDLNIFRDPLNPHTYFAGKEGTFGFNQLHLNALYDLQSRRYVDALIQEPYEENESSAMIEMIKKLTANQKTIIMADRGYETYNIFANIQERGLFYLIRIKDTSKKGSISGSLSLPVSCEFDEEIELIMIQHQGWFKGRKKKELQNEIDELKSQIRDMKDYLPRIVQKIGYRSVQEFLKDFKASQTEYSQYRTAIEKWKKETGKEPVAHGIRAKLAEKKQKIQNEQKNKQHTRSQNKDRRAR